MSEFSVKRLGGNSRSSAKQPVQKSERSPRFSVSELASLQLSCTQTDAMRRGSLKVKSPMACAYRVTSGDSAARFQVDGSSQTGNRLSMSAGTGPPMASMVGSQKLHSGSKSTFITMNSPPALSSWLPPPDSDFV